jgi:16S rRNA (cytosine1402-N4)-methyltransferase
MSAPHLSVLLNEVVEALEPGPGKTIVDGTFGAGGYSRAFLDRGASVVAFDRDPSARHFAEGLAPDQFRLVEARFSELSDTVEPGSVDGVALDLGVSSMQLDEADRGFSFMRDGPLDMRMDPDFGVSAAGFLAGADEREIAAVIARLGEERHARRIARAIVAARSSGAIETTGRLAGIVAAAVPGREPGRHPATRTFQALRIHVNDELGELQQALPQAVAALKARGRLVVISFHSLEDRIVKRFMRSASREAPEFAAFPQLPPGAARPRLKLIGKATFADESEVARNPRARSAVMRVAERLAA